MDKELKNRAFRKSVGLSGVVTTLILLVVAVLLAAVVSHYATALTLTRSQTEEVRLSKERVWVNTTGAAAAFKLQNVGGRDILIEGVIVRNIECDWSDLYYCRVPSGSTMSGEMNITSPSRLTGGNVTIEGRTYKRANADIPLVSGGVLLFYIKGLTNIRSEDIGTNVGISVCTNNSQYITDCRVESATRQ